MTDAEKKYRAQWIRDAARDLLVARLRSGPTTVLEMGEDGKVVQVDWVAKLAPYAVSLWDLYVKERE